MPMATQANDHYQTFTLLVSIWSLLELNLLSICLQALVGLWILTHDGMLLAVHRQYRAGENLFSNTQIICDQIQTSFFYSFWHSHVEEGNPASLHLFSITALPSIWVKGLLEPITAISGPRQGCTKNKNNKKKHKKKKKHGYNA